jgi:hypothetical protein
MKTLLKLEELAQCLACVLVLVFIGVPWWAYVLLALGPDVGMAGYLVGQRTGAFTYNLLHHKGVALLLLASGLVVELANMLTNVQTWIIPAAVILFGHASLDRVFGFGLKFGDSFHHTHLGWIGRGSGQ